MSYYYDENGKLKKKKGNEKQKNLSGKANFYYDESGKLKRRKQQFSSESEQITKPESEERTWFQKGAFEDGYQFGDLTKSIIASADEVQHNLRTGVVGMGEQIVDAGATIVGGIGGIFSKDFKEDVGDFIEKDLYDEEKVADNWITKLLLGSHFDMAMNSAQAGGRDIDEEDSVLGEKTNSLVQSASQMGVTAGLQALGVPWWLTTGVTSFGSGMESSLKEGATYNEAVASAGVQTVAEVLTEKMFGGSGLGEKGLINLEPLTKGIANKVVKTFADYGIDVLAEGTEEFVSQIVGNLGTKFYKDESMKDILLSEEALEGYLESFIGGAVIGGGMNVGNVASHVSSKTDYRTDLTANEQRVLDAEVEKRISAEAKKGEVSKKRKREIEQSVMTELKRGEFDIDSIERTFAEDSYRAHDSITKESEEYTKLYETPSGELSKKQQDRLAELEMRNREKAYSDRVQEAREKLTKDVRQATAGDQFIQGIFAERGKRGQAFQADVSKYDEKQRATIQKAIDSGIMNDTRRTHEFVDLMAKLSADKGVSFDFANNEKLKESGFAIEGKTVNGVKQGNNITININSAKALNSVVGHEITHVLEGTEHYEALQKAVFEYAKTKGEYDSRLKSVTELYKNVKDADVNQELTADLIGDYLFTDEKFVRQLSAQDRNIFQKIYDEIKYLCKVATAGSKEARQLVEVEKLFDKVYRETSKQVTEKTQNSILGIVDLSSDNELQKRVDGLYGAEKYKKIQEYILDILGEQPIKLSDGKEAVVDNSDALHIANKAATKKTAQIAQIKELVEKAQLYAEDKNVEHNKFDYFCYYRADVKFEEDTFSIYLNVGKGKSDAKYHIYDITNKIRDTADRINGLERPKPNEGYALTNDISNNIISQDGKNTTKIQNSISEQSTTDSSGVELSKEQQEYFKDSKVRDENGNLKVVYHGTSKGGHTVFDSWGKGKFGLFGIGTYTTEDKSVAESYTKKGKGDSPMVYEMYANITNPLDMDADADISKWKSATNGKVNFSDVKTNEDAFKVLKEYCADNEMVRWEAEEYILDVIQYNMGYDGITHIGGGRFNSQDTNRHRVWIAFESGQLKNVDNTNPTENPDINMSLSDNTIAPEPPTSAWDVRGKDIALEGVPIRDDIAPIGTDENGEVAPVQPDEEDIFTMDEEESTPEDEEEQRLTERAKQKIHNIEVKIQGFRVSKDAISEQFDESIARKQEEYDSLKRKDTAKASKLLTQINDLKARKENELEEIDRKIKGQREGIERIESQARARRRKAVQKVMREKMRTLIGDTYMWKDKKTGIGYQTQTLRRNLRDVVRDTEGKRDIAKADAIYEELQGTYNHHEAELNREANQIKQEFRDMEITKEENVYAQMLGEYRHNPECTLTPEVMQEYLDKHRDKINAAKVDKIIERARTVYDSLYRRVNEVLREQGMREIGYREGYFPHFTEESQSWIAKLFNWKVQNNEIPTDIAGLTEQFTPDRSWQSFNKHRTGDVTAYNFSKGLDAYVQGALDWIYHIEDIQKRRAFENEIRYQHSAKGIQEQIDDVHQNAFYDADQMQEEIDRIYKNAKNPLNNFVQDLRKGTNVLAGKKDSSDRSMESRTNRQIYSTMTNISSRVSANMVAGSVSSALTNFIPITQSWGQVSPWSSLGAMKDTILSIRKDDGTIAKSDFLTNRLRKSENLYKTGWDIASEKVGFLMEAVDSFTSQVVWRSKYAENLKAGMNETDAIKNADQFSENVMAGRSRGNMPTIFNEKNLVTRTLTAFQLEVANQYGYMFKDMPQDMKNESVGKLIKGYSTMFLGAYAYNALYSTLVGRDAAFDPVGILEDLLRDFGLFGDDDEEEEVDPLNAAVNLATNVMEEVPFIGGLMGGGRIPISSALPYDGISVDSFTEMMTDVSEGDWKNIGMEWLNPVYYLAMPMGGGQLRKTLQGLGMYQKDLPVAGSYTSSGKLRFTAEESALGVAQAAVFGQYASKNAREYFDEGRSPLAEKKVQELIDLDIPISEYWDIQDKLKGKKKLGEKADVIADLDLPIDKKNLLINNAAGRKEPIDLTDYNLYDDFDEFDYAQKNPGKYQVSRLVGGYGKYKAYSKALNKIKGDKNKIGETISGSKKKKVLQYIRGMDISNDEKMLLFKSEFPADDHYNGSVINYIKSSDLSNEDKRLLFEELGFTVTSDGKIRW